MSRIVMKCTMQKGREAFPIPWQDTLAQPAPRVGVRRSSLARRGRVGADRMEEARLTGLVGVHHRALESDRVRSRMPDRRRQGVGRIEHLRDNIVGRKVESGVAGANAVVGGGESSIVLAPLPPAASLAASW